MRVLRFCLIGLMIASPGSVFAQDRPLPRAVPAGPQTRYFTSIDGLMDGNADVILKETRQGKTVTAAVLDVCYPAEKGSDRKDRFVVDLAVNGTTLTGTTQSIGDKLPVTVKLIRKPTADTFEFKGQIKVGQTTTEVTSTDNSDISEAEFKDSQPADDGIAVAPKDFTEASPEALAVKVKLESVVDLLKSLKGQRVEVALDSLTASCDALRAGEQIINLNVDPDRASALLTQLKTMPGVVTAGWSSGIFDMDRTLRFPSAGWRDGNSFNRNKLARAISDVLAGTLSAKPVSSTWNDNTGQLTMVFKRPSTLLPALGLMDTIEVSAMAAPDKPTGSDHMLLWIGSPSTSTADESTGPRLNLVDQSADDGEGGDTDETGSIPALVKAFKAQRWDADKSVWK